MRQEPRSGTRLASSSLTTVKTTARAPQTADRTVRGDRDAQPLTRADFKRMKRTPQVRIIRRALELTQEEFSGRYHIPLGTLRDWEQGRSTPDEAARALLTVIAHDPQHVDSVLNRPTRGVKE